MIPVFTPPGQILWSDLWERDELLHRYRAFFALLDWEQVPERAATRPWPGPVPHPRSAYIKAFLVKICEGKTFVTDLRTYLVEHPLLVLALGFHPVAAPEHLYGFDVERTVPSVGWLREQLRTLDETMLGNLLQGTVHAFQREIPDLGQTVAFDVKHLYAWVQQNNPKAFLAQRFDPSASRRAIRTVAWGSSGAGTRREPTGPRPAPPSTSGATVPGSRARARPLRRCRPRRGHPDLQ